MTRAEHPAGRDLHLADTDYTPRRTYRVAARCTAPLSALEEHPEQALGYLLIAAALVAIAGIAAIVWALS